MTDTTKFPINKTLWAGDVKVILYETLYANQDYYEDRYGTIGGVEGMFSSIGIRGVKSFVPLTLNINRKLDSVADYFDFTVPADPEFAVTFYYGMPCKIIVNGQLYLSGSIMSKVSIDNGFKNNFYWLNTRVGS